MVVICGYVSYFRILKSLGSSVPVPVFHHPISVEALFKQYVVRNMMTVVCYVMWVRM